MALKIYFAAAVCSCILFAHAAASGGRHQADGELLKQLSKKQEIGYAYMVAAMLGAGHHSLIACAISTENDPFFADNNPIQQKTVRDIQRFAPDVDTATLNRPYRLAYTTARTGAAQDFDPERCRHISAQSWAAEKKRLLKLLK